MLTMDEIASRLGIGRTTLYRALGRVRAVPIGGNGTTAKPASKSRSPSRKPGTVAVGRGKASSSVLS